MTAAVARCMIECPEAVGPDRLVRVRPSEVREYVDLSLETRHEDGHTIIEVGGEIDVYTAPKL
ncbi:MAG TPA: hypothetical protein VFV40_05095, partial [Nocardioides sp.]|nr:hypothetical protein [Nocardioides sp.]